MNDEQQRPMIPATYTPRCSPTPTDARERFDTWFYSPAHQAYLAAVAARGGTPLDDPEQAFQLYRQRWTQPEPPQGLLTNLEEIRA